MMHFTLSSKTRARRGNSDRFGRRLAVELLENRHLLAQTVGLFINEPESFEGYTLFAPSANTTTYLIDHQGREVNSWQSDYPPMSAYLLENGSMIRAARLPGVSIFAPGASGRIERFDWEGNLEWQYTLSNSSFQLHHDFEVMPNGNILMIAWERMSWTEAVAAGRNPALLSGNNNELWPDMIIEVKPDDDGEGGEIVWEWHLWDHLIQSYSPSRANYGSVSAHPELVNLNFVPSGVGAGAVLADWTHFNGIDYNPELDQIIVSSREFSEFWVIDHSTTTAEAASHSGGDSGMGGDILYRWGNPRTYGRPGPQQMFYQHDAQWIEPGLPGAGNILVFNNGWNRPANFSSVIELEPGYSQQWRLNVQNNGSLNDQIIFSTPQIAPGWLPLTGDWDGDGLDTGGVFDPATRTFYLNNKTDGSTDSVISFTTPAFGGTLRPIAGDWNGDGIDTPGLYDPNAHAYYLNDETDGTVDNLITFVTPPLPASWIPIAGDWNGDGLDTVGLYDHLYHTFYLNNEVDGTTDTVIRFQTPVVPDGWVPVAGDWNGNGRDTIGLYDPVGKVMYLNNRVDGSVTDLIQYSTPFALTGEIPVTGDWLGTGRDTAGFYDRYYSEGDYRRAPGAADGPGRPLWDYRTPGFFASIISGAQRLANGNTLIDEGTEGNIFEVTPQGRVVWRYVNPVTSRGPLNQGAGIPPSPIGILGALDNLVFRAYRYSRDYPGLADKDLIPGDPIEGNPIIPPGVPDQLGLSAESRFFYLDTTGNNHWDGIANGDTLYDFGLAGLQNEGTAIVGDWDGDGTDDLGVYNEGYFYLDTTGNGVWDGVAQGDTFRDFGINIIRATAQPVVGDWNGDGIDDLGLFNNGYFYLDTTGNGAWDSVAGGDAFRDFGILRSNGIPVIGDWDANGADDLGLYAAGIFYLDATGNGVWDSASEGDVIREFGIAGIRQTASPVSGDWDGDGTDDIGLFNDRYFYLDTTGNGVWDGVAGGDTFWNFALTGDRPIIGVWPGPASGASVELAAAERAVTSPGQHPDDPADVNGDGQVSPGDVLLVINDLNQHGAREFEMASAKAPFLDANGDFYVSSLDVLSIINRLNYRVTEAEGEWVPAGRASMLATVPASVAAKQTVFAEFPGISEQRSEAAPVSLVEMSRHEADRYYLAPRHTRSPKLDDELLELALDGIAADVAEVELLCSHVS